MVTAINFAGGSGYTSAPTVTIASPVTGSLAVNYTYPNTTGTLTYTVAPNTYGTANITLTVMNSGSTDNGGQNVFVQTIPITVNHVNQAPGLLPIPNSAILPVNATATATATVTGGTVRTVTVTSGGAGYASPPAVTFTGGGTAVTPPTATVTVVNGIVTAITVTGGSGYTSAPTVTIASPATVPTQAVQLVGIDAGPGDLPYNPNLLTATAKAFVSGGVVNNVTVTTSGAGYTSTPTVTLTGGGSGAKFVPATAIAVLNNNGMVTAIQITNPGSGYTTAPTVTISAQPQGQFLRVTATTTNTNLIASETVVYTNPSTTGTLFYTLKPGASGVAIISVNVTDDGGTARGGHNSTVQSFTVTVEPLNHAPTINVVNPISLIENSPQQSLALSGITDGDNKTQVVTSVTATSSNTNLIPNPVITYTNPNTTGTLTYTPVPGNTGTATITLTVMDNGGTANGGINAVTETFVITVIPINHSPTLDPISSPAPIFENAPAQTIGLTGISDGDNMTQFVIVTAVSSNPALIQNPTVNYTNPSTVGTLTYTPVANASGTAKITVTATDNGGTANGGINVFSQTFTVVVTAVNQPPTITSIAPITILENSGTQTLNLTGITRGAGDPTNQIVTVAVSSSNPTLIPTPQITYNNPSQIGTLTYAPAQFASGSSVITLTVMDSGGTANGGINTTVQTFTVVVLPVNQAPTLDPITSPAPILENVGQQTINITGISDGIGDLGQTVTVTAISSNPGLISPTVTITHPTGSTDSIIYTPTANTTGTATISVLVTDSGGTSNGGINTFIGTFTVVVTGINAPPTITAIPSLPGVLENSGPQTVNLFGISDGLGDVNQTVTITATSSNPNLIPNPSIRYTNPNTTGTLTFTPVAFGIGSAKITVTLMDNGGTANGGNNVTVTSFNVTVNPVNQPPTLTLIPDQGPFFENTAGTQTVSLSGITDGIGETGQSLAVTATTNNTSLITSPLVMYTSPGNTGTLTYSLQPNASGTAKITVTVTDNGATVAPNVNTLTQSFNVVVTPVNQAPTLGVITSPQPILENAGQQTIGLTGITDGPGDSGQNLTVTVTSNNTAVIPVPAVTYTSPSTTGSLTYTPVPFTHGTAMITVTVTDSGGTAGGGHNTVSQSFQVQVTQVNQAPTLDPLNNLVLAADPGQQTVNLTGIGVGAGDQGTQTVNVSASSSNAAVVANPITVNYSNPSNTGTLVFTPVAGASGVTTITVIVQDTGGTANSGVNFVAQSFTVAVNPAHVAPVVKTTSGTLAYLQNQAATPIDPGVTVTDSDSSTLTGATVTILSPSFNASQDILGFTPQGVITGSYSATTGVLTLSGTASVATYQSVLQSVTYFNNSNFPNGGLLTPVNRTVQFKVNDGDAINGLGSDFRSIVITPVNHIPSFTLNASGTTIPLLENAGQQTINLTGISDGDNQMQGLTFTVTSSNTAVIPTPVISYNSPDKTGVLTYTTAKNAFGLATITVTLTDDGGTQNGGQNSLTQMFSVNVGAVNQAPTLDPIKNTDSTNNFTLDENGPPVTVNLTGITDGDQGRSS